MRVTDGKREWEEEGAPGQPDHPLLPGATEPDLTQYAAPTLERIGSFRELTMGGGNFNPGDGTQAFHRYDPLVS